ncbi:hypothetical protein BC939DRAFT_503511 [Gamsiella multidivaricata]|uniref:uncharacterized protein n=1 Tax=Gamsiella multidivaricata TaxID=101098 RepID=UPI00221E5BCA|nr:uncharacterized protein BC939DRAFT_503511 [Gamsiella multidivaricata]KAI7823044.1 hypothetical protein BC939DRAFT_503511 [Gamsiella multidivaricata]
MPHTSHGGYQGPLPADARHSIHQHRNLFGNAYFHQPQSMQQPPTPQSQSAQQPTIQPDPEHQDRHHHIHLYHHYDSSHPFFQHGQDSMQSYRAWKSQQPSWKQGQNREQHPQQQNHTLQETQRHDHAAADGDEATYRSFPIGSLQHVLVPDGYRWRANDCNNNDLDAYETSSADHRTTDHPQHQEQQGYTGSIASPANTHAHPFVPRFPASRTRHSYAPSPENLHSYHYNTHVQAHSNAHAQAHSSHPSPSNLYHTPSEAKTSFIEDLPTAMATSTRKAWTEAETAHLLECVAIQTQEAKDARRIAGATRLRFGAAVASHTYMGHGDGEYEESVSEFGSTQAAAALTGMAGESLTNLAAKGKNWHRIAQLHGHNRTWASCSNKYQKVMKARESREKSHAHDNNDSIENHDDE